MKDFQANKSYYSENYQSYSSDDEFKLSKRVQITNEMPPQDMYDMSHSMIKNDLWKWFFGSSFLSFDVSYNEDTDGVETLDSDGYIKNATIAKYVNGIRAKDYGPKPAYEWNPDYKKDYQEYADYVKGEDIEDPLTEDDFKYKVVYPTYHRIEIDGALLPEVDLFLHEIYRYLSVLYPDHPDFTQLLTNNEFNDDIMQAGALIDYVPDFTYFEWLSRYLDYKDLDQSKLALYYEDEAAKLKIRNLTSFAFNRKFAGSKSGIKMFISNIFQHVSIYPAAQYVPYELFEENDDDPAVQDFKWYVRFYSKPDGFTARNIDKNHALYKKLFRLIDWTNASYDFLHRWKEPAKFYGTAYPTPYSQFDLYEYPNQRVLDDSDIVSGLSIESLSYTMADDFKAGQKIKINGQENGWTSYLKGHIAYIEEEPSYSVTAQISSDPAFIKSTSPTGVVHVAVDTSVQPVYTELKVFPGVRQLIDKVIEHDNLENVLAYDRDETHTTKQRFRIKWTDTEGKEQTQDYLSAYYGSYTTFTDCVRNFYKAFYGLEDNESDRDYYLEDKYKFSSEILSGLKSSKISYRVPKKAKFTPDPRQLGCLYMAPQQFITTFADTLNVSLTMFDYDEESKSFPESEITFGATTMSEDGYVQKNDLLVYEDEQGRDFAATVLDISNAYLQFSLGSYKADYDTVQGAVDEANKAADEGISKYGLVMRLSDNNQYAGGKKVVFFGTPHFSDATESSSKYTVSSVYFDIKAIPRIKTHAELLAIYGDDFQNVADKKAAALKTLIGKGKSGSTYNGYRTILDTLMDSYEKFETAYNNLITAMDNNNVVYNDKWWNKFIITGNAVIDALESRPHLQMPLKESFEEFVATYDVLKVEILFTSAQLSKAFAKIESQFTEYYSEAERWLNGEIAIIVDCEEYSSIDRKNLNYDYKTVLNTLDACDDKLEDMLPNRAFLLSPLPDDLLLRDLEEAAEKDESYSLLTGQDTFVSILEVTKNKYDDLLELKTVEEFGDDGLLTNCLSYSADAWNFGSLNTATVAVSYYDNDAGKYILEDVTEQNDFLKEKFIGTSYIEDYEADDPTNEEFGVTDIPYKALNEKLQSLVRDDNESYKFAYADPNFMEVFLPDSKKNNIQGEVLSYNTVKINAHFTEDSDEITFEEEAAISAMQYLSTGDQVIGKTVADDTFIEAIDIENHKITVSNKMYVTDEAVLTFLCKVQFEPDDISSDFYNYRVRASRKTQAEQGTPLAHSYTTDFSQIMLTPPIDLEEYREATLKALQEQTTFRASFNQIVKQTYNYENDPLLVAAPSTPNCEGNMMIDVNAYMSFDDDQYIMSQKTLDYVYSYLADITRISDNVSLGASLNAYTTSDSMVTEDEHTKSKFVVSNNWLSSYPAYVKIGTGANEIKLKDPDADEEKTVVIGDVYGDAVYGDATYARTADLDEDDDDSYKTNFTMTDLEKPLFKSYIGEYEVLKSIALDGSTFTALQFSIMKRAISGLSIEQSANVSQKMLDKDALQTFKESYKTYKINSVIKKLCGTTKIVKYLGEYTPKITKDGDRFKLVMPEAPERPNTARIIYYYSIAMSNSVVDVSDKDFLVYNDDGWHVKKFYFMGFIGSSENYQELIDNNVNISYILTEASPLRKVLLQKTLSSMQISSSAVTEEDYVNVLSKVADDDCYLFEFLGQTNADVSLPAKTFIGLMHNGSSFDVVLFNKGLTLAKQTFDAAKLVDPSTQYESAYLSRSSTLSGLLLSECIDSYKTTFELAKLTNLVKGTFSAVIRMKLGYTTTGHLYNEDGEVYTDDEHKRTVDLTYNYFYPDEDNLKFYTYDDEGTKIAVDQMDNKYFKNIINNIMQFTTEQSITSDGLVTKAKLVPVEGFDFQSTSMTPYDRILSLEKVNLRSAQSESLEPTVISKYTSFKSHLYSYDSANKTVKASYKLYPGVKDKTAKNDFTYEIEKLLPYDTDDTNEETNTYADDKLEYDKDRFKDNIIYSPNVVDFNTFDEDDVDHYIKYFKNRLLLVGYVTLPASGSATLTFKHQNALKGISQIAVNDTLEDTALLESPELSQYTMFAGISNKTLLGIGYKYGIFYEFYTDGISAKRCDSLESLEASEISEDGAPVNYTWCGFNESLIESFAWDEDLDCWIVTCSLKDSNAGSNGQYGGIWGVSAAINDDTTVNLTVKDMTSNGSSFASQDIDTFQLITVMSKNAELNSEEDDETTEGQVLARDIAFADFDPVKTDANASSQSLGSMKLGGTNALTQDINLSIEKSQYTYTELTFAAKVPEVSASLQIKCQNSEDYYYYNNELNRWEQFLTADHAFIFKNLSDTSSTGLEIKAKVFLCPPGSEDWMDSLTNNGDPYQETAYSFTGKADDENESQFLWALPRPIDDEYIYFAIVCADTTPEITLQAYGTFTSSQNVEVKDITATSCTVISNSTLPKGSYTNFFYRKDLNGKLLVASNENGQMAALNGKYIFVKSPKKIYKAIENEDGTTNTATSTDSSYWTLAHIPAMKDISYENFASMDVDELYDLVNSQLSLYKSYYSSESNLSAVEKARYNVLSSLVIVTPEQFIDTISGEDEDGNEFDYTNNLIVKGIKYVETPDGRVPVFCDDESVQDQCFEQYNIPINVTTEAGRTVAAYLRNETYVSYLRDLYMIALGCNNVMDFTKSIENVKYFGMNDQSIQIITANDDILVLPLDKTYSRDAIENAANWNIKSICPALEVPSYEETSAESLASIIPYKTFRGVYTSSGESWEYDYPTTTYVTKKIYSLVSWLSKDVLSAYAGTVNSTNGLTTAQKEYISNYWTATSDSEDAAASVPKGFVAVSNDDGDTYSYKPLTGFDISTDKGVTVIAMYLIGDSVRIMLKSGDSYTTKDASFSSDNGELTLSETTVQTNNIDITDSSWVSTDMLNGSAAYSVYNDKYFITTYNAKAVLKGTVTAVTDNTVTVELSSETSVSASETVEVKALFSFNTLASIQNQAMYLDFSSELLDTYGMLKVEKTSVVDTYNTANLAYSRNENFTEENWDSTYFPCVAKDIDSRNVYNYTLSTNAAMETVAAQVDAVNDSGEYIYLYDEPSDCILFARNSEDISYKKTLESIYANSDISIDDAERMASVRDDYEFIYNDSSYYAENGVTIDDSTFKVDLNNVKLTESVFTADDENDRDKYVTIKNSVIADILDKVIESNDRELQLKYFYMWPKADQSTLAGLKVQYGEYAYGAYVDSLSSTEPFIAKLKALQDGETLLSLDALEGFHISIDGYDNGGLVKSTDGSYLLNEKVLSLVLSMSYNAKNSQFTIFDNTQFNVEDNVIAQYSGSSINAVYLDPVGYGGILGNEDFTTQWPWTLDSEAFGINLLKNDKDEFVYMSDAKGNNLTVKNGLFVAKENDSLEFTWDTLAFNDNIVSIRDPETNIKDYSDALQYHFYKIDNSATKIYAPCLDIKKHASGKLTLVRVYKDSRDETAKLADGERYTFEATSNDGKFYSDEACTIETEVTFTLNKDGSDYFLSCDNAFYVKDDTLTLTVTDTLDSSETSAVFTMNDDAVFIESMTECYRYYDENSSASVSFTYDKELALDLDSDSDNVSITTTSTGYKLDLQNEGVESISAILTKEDSSEYETTIYVDCHYVDPVLYVSRENAASASDIRYEVYDGCEKLDAAYETEETDDSFIVKATLDVNGSAVSLEKTVTKADITAPELLKDLDNATFVYAIDTEKCIVAASGSTDKWLVDGAPGQLLMVTPAYKSFETLVGTLGRVIAKDDFVYTYAEGKANKQILSMASIDYTYVYLDSLSTYKGELADLISSTDYIRAKILPLNSVLVDTSVMNSPDYYAEVPLVDIATYSYDRVWINEDVYLPPVVATDDVIFNSESLSQYSTTLWENKDNIPVYLCDENGKFVKRDQAYKTSLHYATMGDDLGNCSSEKYQSVDPRLNPYEIQHKTAYDYFYSLYYSADELCNPFVKNISVKDTFIDGKWTTKVSSYIRRKVNSVMKNYADSTVTAYSKSYIKKDSGFAETSIVDYDNGTVSLFINADGADTSEYLTLAGIKYFNPLSKRDFTSGNCLSYSDDNADAKFSFNVCSTEDPANAEKSNVADITEMGIFDKDDHMIAYMTHPIMQYDTSKNHISYNLLVGED